MQLSLNAPKIWFYQPTVDFRKSIDGLVGLIQSHMDVTLTEGIFVFCNRNKDKLKLLAWHGNGFVLLYKRLEKERFTVVSKTNAESVTLNQQQLSWLLAGLDWDKMRSWNTLSYDDYC